MPSHAHHSTSPGWRWDYLKPNELSACQHLQLVWGPQKQGKVLFALSVQHVYNTYDTTSEQLSTPVSVKTYTCDSLQTSLLPAATKQFDLAVENSVLLSRVDMSSSCIYCPQHAASEWKESEFIYSRHEAALTTN